MAQCSSFSVVELEQLMKNRTPFYYCCYFEAGQKWQNDIKDGQNKVQSKTELSVDNTAKLNCIVVRLLSTDSKTNLTLLKSCITMMTHLLALDIFYQEEQT